MSSHQDSLEIGQSRPYPVDPRRYASSAGRLIHGQDDTVEVDAEEHAGAV